MHVVTMIDERPFNVAPRFTKFSKPWFTLLSRTARAVKASEFDCPATAGNDNLLNEPVFQKIKN